MVWILILIKHILLVWILLKDTHGAGLLHAHNHIKCVIFYIY